MNASRYMRLGLVDDDPLTLAALHALVNGWRAEHGMAVVWAVRSGDKAVDRCVDSRTRPDVVLGVSMWAVRENRIRLSAVYLGLNLLFALALSPIGARVVLGLEHHANLAFGVQGIFLMDKVLRLLSIDFMSVGGSALTVNYQWMMVFARPLMLLYNRRRGPGVKWFFYAFYPAHIVALHGIGMALGGAA